MNEALSATSAKAAVGELIKFTHADTVLAITPGTYEGEVVIAPHVLGENGMKRSWRFVKVTKVPDGSNIEPGVCINVW